VAAGLPETDLPDVRHSYATSGRDAKINWKALSKHIGHADFAFTMKQYVQTDLEARPPRGYHPGGADHRRLAHLDGNRDGPRSGLSGRPAANTT
jgi:hypothetical protein